MKMVVFWLFQIFCDETMELLAHITFEDIELLTILDLPSSDKYLFELSVFTVYRLIEASCGWFLGLHFSIKLSIELLNPMATWLSWIIKLNIVMHH